MKRTKIICTIGPASETVEKIKTMALGGMDVARINLSHGTLEDLNRYIQNIHQASEKINKPIPILLDTQGPEIRIGSFIDNKVQLVAGRLFTLTIDEKLGDQKSVSVLYDGFIHEVKEGMVILLNDGLIKLRVEKECVRDIVCRVEVGGELSNHKKINIPESPLSLPSLSQMDKDKLRRGITLGIDFIAGSFIRSAQDVQEITQFLSAIHRGQKINMIAKIENQSGIDHLDEIIKAADGIMIARGDLGVEIMTEAVPVVQKEIIKKCNECGKPVITATQMLESMTEHSTPTRAEASDVANAILDGTDAVMLSGETAVGKFAIEAVETMTRIAIETEKIFPFSFRADNAKNSLGVPDVICQSAVSMAKQLNARVIITPTHSGYTACHVAKYRPQAPILAVTDQESVYRQLFLVWGTEPFLTSFAKSTDLMLEKGIEHAKSDHRVKAGDYIVITAGVPVWVTGTTNLVKVHQV